MRSSAAFIIFILLSLEPLFSKEATVSFDLSPGSPADIRFGFTDRPDLVTTVSVPENLDVYSIQADGVKDEGLNVFYLVRGSSSFSLLLYAKGPLMRDEEELPISITWTCKGSGANAGSSLEIGSGKWGADSAGAVYDRTLVNEVVEADTVPLAIAASPDWDQRAGTYKGVLVLAIEST